MTFASSHCDAQFFYLSSNIAIGSHIDLFTELIPLKAHPHRLRLPLSVNQRAQLLKLAQHVLVSPMDDSILLAAHQLHRTVTDFGQEGQPTDLQRVLGMLEALNKTVNAIRSDVKTIKDNQAKMQLDITAMKGDIISIQQKQAQAEQTRADIAFNKSQRQLRGDLRVVRLDGRTPGLNTRDVSKADLTSVLGYNNLSPANLLSCLRFYGLPTEGDPVSKVETLLEFCAPRV